MVQRTPPVSLFRVPRRSTVDLIATELRQAIFTGALHVGSAIGEVEMSSQLGVSRSPLREATQRLVQEGLLIAHPGRGLRVSVIDAEQVGDVYEARAAIEARAARIVARRRDEGALAAIEEAYNALVAVSQGTEARAIGDADLAFHQALVDAAGSPRLSKAMQTLAIETRIASFSDEHGYTVRRSVSPTYTQLLEALRAGDPDAAAEALERQFEAAVARLRGQDEAVDTVEAPEGEEPPTLGPLGTLELAEE